MDPFNFSDFESEITPESDIFNGAIANDKGVEELVSEDEGLNYDSDWSSDIGDEEYEDVQGVFSEERLINENLEFEMMDMDDVNLEKEPLGCEEGEASVGMEMVVANEYDKLYDFDAFSDIGDDNLAVMFVPSFERQSQLDGGCLSLCVGMSFDEKDDVKRACQEWHIKKSLMFGVHKSTPKLYWLRCRRRSSTCCQWYLRAIKPHNSSKWVIRTMGGDHTCQGMTLVRENVHLNAEFIAHKIKWHLKGRLDLSPKTIKSMVKKDYAMNIKYKKAWKSRVKALEILFGGYKESFATLPRYFDVMKVVNPGTIVIWDRLPSKSVPELAHNDISVVKRVFWSWGGAIEAFSHCPPVIFIDGTFLSGKYKGVLLTAIAIDAKNHLFQ